MCRIDGAMRFPSFDSLWFIVAGSLLALLFVSFFYTIPSEVVALGFFLAALPTMSAFVHNNRSTRGMATAALLLFVVYGIYAVAVSTGFPFGKILLGDAFGAKLYRGVPWSFPFIWAPVLIAVSSVSAHVFRSPLVRFFGAAAFVVLFDLLVDPVAVRMGLWSFGSVLAGVPLFNYFGWALVGLFSSGILFFALGHDWFDLGKSSDEYVKSLLISGPFFSLLAIEFHLVFSALVGLFLCMVLLALTYTKEKSILETAPEVIFRRKA